MIEIKDLSLSYGGRKVLDNMNLKLDDGKIVGLVGENGTGFRVIIAVSYTHLTLPTNREV